MTNGWIDMKNADVMLIMGGNPAENHPCGFKWPIEAKRQRNAKMIAVDPRFTRTAATADLFVQIRAGSDIAFLGGLINYAIEHGRFHKEYLVHYTNAAFLIKDDFELPEQGLFSGFDAATQTYDKSAWNYQGGAAAMGASGGHTGADAHGARSATSGEGQGYQAHGQVGAKAMGPGAPAMPAQVAYDLSLEHPRSVFQLL